MTIGLKSCAALLANPSQLPPDAIAKIFNELESDLRCDDTESLNLLMVSLAHLLQQNAAIALQLAALLRDRFSSCLDVRYSLIELWIRRGDYDEAELECQEILNAVDTVQDRIYALHLWLSAVMERGDRPDQARQLWGFLKTELREVLEKRPNLDQQMRDRLTNCLWWFPHIDGGEQDRAFMDAIGAYVEEGATQPSKADISRS